ncbi:FMN-binding negative transcriptional regulator [Streptomyces ziwulingensis]|uniref:FMN-binding negative transcriptional regulator n=1 Tax=Streptomyces ziwulingensis TaxID=1045501 RepID=UPI0031F036F5
MSEEGRPCLFVPDLYREPADAWIDDLIRRYPLALLVSNGGAGHGPFATNVPVIRDPGAKAKSAAETSEDILLGHMNRQNPHWEKLRSGNPVLLAFSGPNAYVSPSIYRLTPAAPTWDFATVHVRGVLEKITSVEETLEVVKSTVGDFEGEFGGDWDMSESLDYFRKIVPGVGAFRVVVSRADGMFKLSQEQEPEVRDRVLKEFTQRDCGPHREVAALMGRLQPPAT